MLGVAFSLFWHIREQRKAIDSARLHAWLRAISRYWLAIEISIYGFGKIFKTQFGPSFSRNDTPVGQLSGFGLTWNYFGHSYTFAFLIAALQIGGSILLLFRRTTLLGATILLPVMINIFLINLFYHIAMGAFLNSILFTLGLIYLLYLRRKELIKLFLQTNNNLPSIGTSWLKQGARLLTIGFPLAYIFILVNKFPDSTLAGKWTVDLLVRNRDTVSPDAWLNSSGAWRTVYIETRNQIHFCPNPYIYDKDRSLDATYYYDSARHQLRLYFGQAGGHATDSVTEAISSNDGTHMDWNGMLGGDTVRLRLSRAGP
jgi:hypothetical protein